MPTLNWIGKEAVVKHHHDVPFHLLKDVPNLSCGEPGSGNLILKADNLIGLKSLLPYYAGQVKCIAIDPPYNTGNEGWAYNDNVNSPGIKKWLGEVVGKEGETLDRHDRWLSMMYPRIALLRQFLREDGAIFVFLDDNEVQSLRYLLDEIFGASNFVATVIWQKVFAPKNTARHFSEDHDYVLIYARSASIWKPNLIPRSEEAKGRYKNPDDDPRGVWTSGDLQARNFYSEGTYPIKCPSGRVIPGPGSGMYWRVSKSKFEELDAEKRIYWGTSGNNMPRLKRFLKDVKDGVTPQTLWTHDQVGHTQEAKKELLSVLTFASSSDVFITPKPTRVMERIIQIATNPGDLVMDSFGGSGTTGHAVLKVNAANPDAEPRRFIMIEMEGEIAEKITAERVRRVTEGYKNAKGEDAPGLGGGFRFCELGEELFDARGQIRESVRFADLARHVYFTATGEPLPKSRVPNTPLLGVHNGRAICLLYNGILKDKSPQGGNALTHETLALIKEACAGEKYSRILVFGTSQRIAAARLKREGVSFQQIPYSLRIS